MKLQLLAASAFIAAITGIAQSYFLAFCWAYIGTYSPLVHWLLHFGLRGPALRTTVFPIDFLTSIIISLPAAFLLTKLHPRKLWFYTLLAVVPEFVWLNWGFIANPLASHFFGLIIVGWLPELFALPIATWLLQLLYRLLLPNNSFKADGSAAA